MNTNEPIRVLTVMQNKTSHTDSSFQIKKPQQVTEVILLAGGPGTRLQPVIKNIPKCMAPVNSLPFLWYVLGHLKKNGLQHFIFSLGYKSEFIIDYLNREFPALHKTYVVEKEPLGTGGAITVACQYVNTENVLVVNADTFFNIDINKLTEAHAAHSADCTIALKLLKNFNRYGAVNINSQSLVKGFTEKQPTASGYINGGIYVLQVNGFLNEQLPQSFSFEQGWLEKNVGTRKIFGVKFNRYFIDIGVPEDYRKATIELANFKL